MSKKYKPTPEVKQKPYWTMLKGKAVGIGGSIKMNQKPPGISYVIPEATESEYKQAFDKGLKGVMAVENKTKEVVTEASTDSGAGGKHEAV